MLSIDTSTRLDYDHDVDRTTSIIQDDALARDKRLQNTKMRRLQILELLRNKDDLDVDEDEVSFRMNSIHRVFALTITLTYHIEEAKASQVGERRWICEKADHQDRG